MSCERFLIPDNGPDSAGEKAGVRWLLEYAAANGHHRAGIVVPGVRAIDNLDRSLGRNVAATLSRQREIPAQAGLQLEVLLASKLSTFYEHPVFVPWAVDDLIDKVEEMHPPAICAMPWAPNDLSVWRSSWTLIDPRSGDVLTEASALDPIVTTALQELTVLVNLSSGILHPSDRASAIDAFKALKLGGHQLDRDAIRAWAAAHDWTPRHAKDLGELAGKIADGVAVRGGRSSKKTELKRHLARWAEDRS